MQTKPSQPILRDIELWPSPVLTADSVVRPDEVDGDVRAVVDELWAVLDAAPKIYHSISAPQIGLQIAIFVMDTERGGRKDGTRGAFINPELVEATGEMRTMRECCLSFPTCSVPVNRNSSIKLKALGLSNEWYTVDADQFEARTMLHELDHLTGRTLYHATPRLWRDNLDKQMRRALRMGQWR